MVSSTQAVCQVGLLPVRLADHICEHVSRRALSSEQQSSYIDAVKCMQSTPGKTAEIYSGVKSLYDDFQALHISQTDNIHWVVSFALFDPFQICETYWARL